MVAKRKTTSRTGRSALTRKGVRRVVPEAKLTKAGQHFASHGLCIATSKLGKACPNRVGEAGVPYCTQHMRTGDPSVRVAAHPLAGKILVAARKLPKGYRVALWGRLLRKKDITPKAMEWAFDVRGGWMIDPTKCKGSMVQYCACAGPHEVAAVSPTPDSAVRGTKFGSWTFITGQALRKDWQLTMQYGDNSKGSDEFFRERGIDRVDVGTRRHPALRRKDAPPLSKAR